MKKGKLCGVMGSVDILESDMDLASNADSASYMVYDLMQVFKNLQLRFLHL